MRYDHILDENKQLQDNANRLAEHIKVREEELVGLKRLHSAIEMAAAGNPEALPSFINPEDEGFKRVAAAADASECRNGRPVVAAQAEQAA